MAERLARKGWHCSYASGIEWRPARFTHMLCATLRHAPRVAVVHIPLFSGAAFAWAFMGSEIARASNTPLVISLHGGRLPEFSKRWPATVRRVLAGATAVVAPSEYLRSALSEFREDIGVMPNAIALDDYPFVERHAPVARLVWLRAFHAIYNPTLGPRVLAALGDRWPAARLLMIGSDKGDGSLQATRRLADELGVADRIDFVGVVAKPDVPTWLHKGDIFVNTSNVDNTPVSVLEAMACGLPVVTTNVGGIPHLVADETEGLLVPPDDHRAFAGAIARLLEEPRLASEISRRARLKVEQLDWSAMIQRWDSLLLEAAHRRSRIARPARS